MLYYLLLSVRARSLTFFSASNPVIPMGGMLGESKYEVLRLLPAHLIPNTTRVAIPASPAQVITAMHDAGLTYPVIFKPDLGERGFMVQRIDRDDQIPAYLSQLRSDLIIQKFIDLPLEFGVFYRRFPNDEKGEVVSIVAKEMLAVTGDGISTLEQLILENDRARLQLDRLRIMYSEQWGHIVPAGRQQVLVQIGNHALGTKFIDGNYLISPKLSESFDTISKQIDGFYFGRYDLRCASIEDLENGRVMVMELNGCGAEPAHIYDPGNTLWAAWRTLARHWNEMFRISVENRRKGHSFIPLKEALVFYRRFKQAIQN